MFAILRNLTTALAVLAGMSVALMMLHVMADVMGKYFFHYPVPSTAEVVANYYMIAVVFLSLAWVEAKGSAISVDLIYDAAPAGAQRIMRKIGEAVTLAFYIGLGWFSWDVAIRAWKVNESVDGLWRVTIWPAKFMLPIGIALACLVLLVRIFAEPRIRIDGGHPEHSEAEA
ncbi:MULTISPECIES: TRAP transporter small permease subunit [Rhodobacterales]|uniref:TRAP transporter small permease subunit n=1 Tax=Rhodobacterales TaxID=204455 RepID=UPI00110890B3|nr:MULTISPECIES: TRAP transporter small permease [Rhodobacterales]